MLNHRNLRLLVLALLVSFSGAASANRAVRAPAPRAQKAKAPSPARAKAPPAQGRALASKAKLPAKAPAAAGKRFKFRNPGSLLWAYSGSSKGGKNSKDARRTAHGLDPFGTSQTLLETELRATIDLSKYDGAISIMEQISKDPKATEALLGKKGWTLKAAPAKEGTLRMRDLYADSPDFALMRKGGTARWRDVQKIDPATGKPLDDKRQLNIKAGNRKLGNGVFVRVEAGMEVPGLVKNGKVDPRLQKFLRNGKYEDNPTNLIRDVLPGTDVMKILGTPLVEISQQRYKFHIYDEHGVDVGEGSIDVVQARPTPQARKLFGKQLRDTVKFGRVEYEGAHVNPTLSPQQLAMAANSNAPHGAFDVYSNTLTQSSDISTLTGIAGRLTKTLGAQQTQGSKVFDAMSRLGFFDHIPGGSQAILDAQSKADGAWQKKVKVANPGFVD